MAVISNTAAADRDRFGFGLEAEFLLVEKNTCKPLFHKDVPFGQLLDLLDAIPVADFSSEGFNIKPLHRLASPYLVEGYYLTDKEMKPYTLLTKGVELRTPLADSIDHCVESLGILTSRLDNALAAANWKTAILSHHPLEARFEAPPNYTRHDYWQWALTAMTTFGPDINISLPEALAKDVDLNVLHDKINYYMPALVALSLASPLLEGGLWTVRGRVGKSIRTYRRSLWAPLYYIHKEPSLRFEFKGFEMAQNLSDYKVFFLLSLALLLDGSLTGSASDQTRTYDMGHIAVDGLDCDFVRERAATVIAAAEKVAARFGFAAGSLDTMKKRLITRRTPADAIIERYVACGSINETLRSLSDFKDETLTVSTAVEAAPDFAPVAPIAPLALIAPLAPIAPIDQSLIAPQGSMQASGLVSV